MLQVCDIVQLVAPKRCTILISGETGTGKEVIAKAIHAASPRSHFPLVSVNCTALPHNLIEAELFGHAKGAFTGAHTHRIGRFEQAHRGTIFLDEIGDLSPEAQAKLLRVLQEQQFERVGSSETIRVDVRVIAASNVDLESAVRARRFREDLYYRLNVVPIQMPALRERRDDIPLLVRHFLAKISVAEGAPPKTISDKAVSYLQNLEWPGNIRQLEHTVQMAVALSGTRELLCLADFQTPRSAGPSDSAVQRPLLTVPPDGLDFDKAVQDLERSLVSQALALSGGNKAKAADLLRIKRTTLLAKMKVLAEQNDLGKDHLSQPACLQLVQKRSTALILEPNDAIRKFVIKTLEKQNFQVVEAANRTAALELIECWGNNISCMIGASGELSECLPELPPELPVVVIGGPGSDTRVFRSPRTRILSSPFSSSDLLQALDGPRSGGTSEQQRICA